MHRVIVRSPGSFHHLEYVEEPDPTPGPGRVLVAVAAAGVNFADCVVRMGLYPSAKEYVGWPITPGFELSGTVCAVGQGVTRFREGDRVFGVSLFGAYASHVVVPEDQLFAVPQHLSLSQAGALSVAGLTAHYALLELGAARPGKKVLVHSATGGVGSALVQIAKLSGCQVTATVGSPAKVAVARQLGADVVIDRSHAKGRAFLAEALRSEPQGYDIVLDANGVETLKWSYLALRPTGRLVVYGAHTMLSRGSGRRHWLKLAWTFLRTPRFDPLRLTNENRSILAFNLSYLFDAQGQLRAGEKEQLHRAMPELLGWSAEGRLRFPELQEIPLRESARAHQALQSGSTIGKLVLVPDRPTD